MRAARRRRSRKGPSWPPISRATSQRDAREWCGIDNLILSLKCGGSDYTSGLSANPALGRVADRLNALGRVRRCSARSPKSWAPNICSRRGPTQPDVAGRLLRVIQRVESEAQALGLDIRGTQPSPGNIRGGLTTIEEKSLGATHKAGEVSPLEDVVPYAARITRKGLTVMDTPGLDVESVTGMVGGGAQVVVFTTGLGTPTGNPDRAGDQDHRQRAHGADDGGQHRSRRERHPRSLRVDRRGCRSAARRDSRGLFG